MVLWLQPAWELGYTGKKVVVTILDDGIQYNHPDLQQNYDPLASKVYVIFRAEFDSRRFYNPLIRLKNIRSRLLLLKKDFNDKEYYPIF